MSDNATNIKKTITTDTGFSDPNAELPKPEYWGGSSINLAASGRTRNDLWTGGYFLQEPVEIVPSRYYDNQIQETKSGHIIEIDDTYGNERILIKHNEGGGIELKSDGSLTVTTPKNKLEVSGGDSRIVVEGEADLVYKGNLTLDVTGDFDINCMNFNVNVNGNKKETIVGSDRQKVGSNQSSIVGGSASKTVTEQSTNTFLGGYSQNVKGTFANNVDGNAGFFASGNTEISSEGILNASSDNMTLAAENMTVMGSDGVIGGESVHIKGQEGSFEGSVEAPTFYGNLIGKAKFAALADKALGANVAGSAPNGAGGTGTAINPADPGAPSFIAPTVALVNTYLANASGGLKKVKIDIGNYIRNAIIRTEAYGGISSTDVDTKKARSRLRDQGNKDNNTFVETLLSDGTVSPRLLLPAPEGIGRIVGFSDKGIANPGRRPYVAKKAEQVRIVPEFKYNPLYQGEITSRTKISEGITIAKFLGTEDATNFEFIRDFSKKADISRYFYLHAQFMKYIQENKKDFENVTLKVTEALYRPGPTEVVTPDSINDLKSKGRAVVYDVMGVNGESDRAVLFDIIVKFKDTMYYDKLILSYDTIDVNAKEGLTARIIVTLPELDDNWSGTYSRNIETQFNGNLLAKDEFVEALPYPVDATTTSAGDVDLDQNGTQFETRLGNSDKGLAQIVRSRKTHPEVQPGAQQTLEKLLANEFQLLQQYWGGELVIVDALPHLDTDRRPPSRGGSSQHWFGRAIDIDVTGMTNNEQNKLAAAAAKAGFRGFGFGNTILHLDIGRKRRWNYQNANWAGQPITDWYSWHSENVRG